MQFITVEQVIDAIVQTREVSRMLFNAILDAAWQNVTLNFVSTTQAFHAHDWNALAMYLFLFFGEVAVLYRLVSNNLLRVVGYFQDH